VLPPLHPEDAGSMDLRNVNILTTTLYVVTTQKTAVKASKYAPGRFFDTT
jgi:hypothetical protein